MKTKKSNKDKIMMTKIIKMNNNKNQNNKILKSNIMKMLNHRVVIKIMTMKIIRIRRKKSRITINKVMKVVKIVIETEVEVGIKKSNIYTKKNINHIKYYYF